MRKPPKGCVWIHVDRLDREDGKVWAVQWWVNGKARYDVAKSVVIIASSYTQFFGAKGKQPKAVIVVEDSFAIVDQDGHASVWASFSRGI